MYIYGQLTKDDRNVEDESEAREAFHLLFPDIQQDQDLTLNGYGTWTVQVPQWFEKGVMEHGQAAIQIGPYTFYAES